MRKVSMLTLPGSSSDSRRTSPTLLRRVQQHDGEAWQILVDLYGPLIHYWLRRSGLSEHDVADLIQEVFAAVARSVERFEIRPDSTFRAWLWMITRNQLVSFFRRRAEQTHAAGGTAAWQKLLQVSQSLSDNPDEFTDQGQISALHSRGLTAVKSEFEHRTWQIFWRVVVDEQPTSLVAEEFETTANTVRQIKSRVLRRLRQVLGEATV
ncbi:MAG: sigma-70 family RNA polymerase sigma factor [Planctomycetaceae bacterium]|nr:sigma-70 family RNA polymerase sigma factor [Planctomycetaceae bacterium]